MALQEPRLQTPEHPVPLAGMYKVIKRLNRNTTWVATGLLGSVVFAALMVAFQERHPKADDLTEARQTTGDLSLNANPATVAGEVANTSKTFMCEMIGLPSSQPKKLENMEALISR